jgi:LPXTG-site transpeptidase (sortase) family protein
MKRRKLPYRTICVLVFIFGLILFLYPFISEMYFSYGNKAIMERAVIPDTPKVVITPDVSRENGEVECDVPNQGEMSSAQEYNTMLYDEPGYVPISFHEVIKNLNNIWIGKDSYGEDIFAYITIEKIGVKLPVYLEETDKHLSKGAAVIQGTSIPIGGENTNSVIAGHTGRLRRLFTRLPELKPGDEIVINNKWDKLYYKVTGNRLIYPYEDEYLDVVSGKDMITLLTCYYGTVKDDRLVVFAERYYPDADKSPVIDITPDVESQEQYAYIETTEVKDSFWYNHTTYAVIVSGMLFLLVLVYIILSKVKGNKY